ncbi:MAG: hypothetical protein ACE5KM_21590, partial [Planctomycetaceae bacterium]
MATHGPGHRRIRFDFPEESPQPRAESAEGDVHRKWLASLANADWSPQAGGLTAPSPPAVADAPLSLAIDRTRDYLLGEQHPDGYWVGELEGDTILESEYILLLAWLGREHSETA